MTPEREQARNDVKKSFQECLMYLEQAKYKAKKCVDEKAYNDIEKAQLSILHFFVLDLKYEYGLEDEI